MKVLVACEFSGRVRDAFLNLGHDAVCVDLLPNAVAQQIVPERVIPHVTQDVLSYARENGPFDLMIAHPPCTHLTVANSRNWPDPLNPDAATSYALQFVEDLWNLPIPRIAIENPPGLLTRLFRKPTQTLTFSQLGYPSSKRFSLWLKNLPSLRAPILRPRGHFQTEVDLPPGILRPYARSVTPIEVAREMAHQWSNLPPL